MIRPLIAIALALSAPALAQAADYTITIQGHVAGKSQVNQAADGAWRIEEHFRDNGRGPDIEEAFALDADGGLRRYTSHGTSTFGAAIDERFERDASGVRWRSPAETEEGRAPDTVDARVHVPVEGSTAFTGVLARQLLRREGQDVSAWTGGALRARRLATLTVKVEGRPPAEADLVVLQGVSLEPDYLWLRHGGDEAMFASVAAEFSLVEAGYEAAGAQLLARQQEADRALRAELAAKLAHRTGPDLLVRDVRVFDAEHAVLGPRSDVYVSRGRIAQVLPAGSTPRGRFTVVEGAGRTLLPGLFDLHVHDDPWSGILHLAGGVTTARDMGNDNASLRVLMDEIDAGTSLGERVVPAGFIEGESEFASRSGFVVSKVEDALAAVDWYAQRGYPQVKLYSSIHPGWVAPIARRAHALGLRVSGHVPAFMRAEEAVDAGYDELQHINFLALNFLAGPKDDTRTLLRFDLVADRANTLDLDGAPVLRFIEHLKEKGVAIDATAATFEAQFTQMQGEPNPSLAAVADHLPAVMRRQLRVNSSDVNAANAATHRASYRTLLGLVGRLHRAGVALEAGTDDLPGFMLHRELALYVQAGIPPAQALRIATWNGARFTRTLDRLGSVTPGKLADLVLVDGDPTTDIDDLRRIALVVKEGVLYEPAELYAALGVTPFAQAPAITVEEH